LGILRAHRREIVVTDSVRAARERWHLTTRQTQVLEQVARGFTNALIADSLGIGEGTVHFHLSAIFDKAGVERRAMLIARLHAR
jgi:DNA-binding NarL/FixJ family response regulator